MTTIFVLITAFLLPVYIAHRAGGPDCGKKLAITVGSFSCLFLILLGFVNEFEPYLPGGDDYTYYLNSLSQLESVGKLIDRIRYTHEQPGYPVFLTFVNWIAGDSLFARKATNIAFFLLISICWRQIGGEIGGKRVAHLFFWGSLLSTPLWFYFLYLLKDMAVTLLFSLFILGSVKFFTSRRGLILMLVSSFGIALLRLPLLLINIAIVVSYALLPPQGKGFNRNLIGGAIVLLSILAGTNSEVLEIFGIAETRILSIESLISRLQEHRDVVEESSTFKSFLLYFLIETSGLRLLHTWEETTLRGITALPWIFLGLPFFFPGCYRIVRAYRLSQDPENRPFLHLLVIVTIYLAVSLCVKDTTRWRIPGFPAMAAIATIGWDKMGRKRRPFLAAFLPCGVIVFVLYYLLKS